MAGRRKLGVAGAAAGTVVLGKVIFELVAFAAGGYAGHAAVTFFTTPKEEREVRAGFEQVSPDWSSWLQTSSDSSASAFARWGALVSAQYLTDDELSRSTAGAQTSFKQWPTTRRRAGCVAPLPQFVRRVGSTSRP